MPRQRSGLSDYVLSIPPPPLPILDEPYSTRFADPDRDAEMISEWMNRPHLAQTWGYDYPPDQWRRHLEVQFEGNYARPYIWLLHGEPIGYMELYRAAQDDIATVYDAHPHDVGLHGAMASVGALRKGHATNILGPLARSVFEADPECRRIMADPQADGSNGRLFWEHIGMPFLGEHYMVKWDQRIALFCWPRTPEDIPGHRATP
ncbi:acetyltransferase [Mycolicibacter arupensis]|jgi:RimJ/RimL family protein N-acetyltransferase|nr:acetyltransferase [Mycolicibacter arupensis]MCV7275660.1 acetyltransferase [Mycolicibacter arupensis]TXI48596.1 MAG: N-acetyltransferase [Mycolicibacter arupensis]